MGVLKKEAVSLVGLLQVCTWQQAGSKAAIHAMEKIFKEESTALVLLL